MKIITALEHPELNEKNNRMAGRIWPEFMLHDHISDSYFHELFIKFPQYQFAMIDETNDELIAIGNSIPLFWDKPFEELPDEGWDWVLEEGVKQHKAGIKPNILSAIQIMVEPEYKNKQLSYSAVEAMQDIGLKNKLEALIAPVRPSLKPNFPLIPIDEYINWKNDEGLAFDAWLRVHEKLGAKLIKVCKKAMYISGTVAQWQEWTNQKFPASGSYIVKGALTPIEINYDNDLGVYVEPNVWMVHNLK